MVLRTVPGTVVLPIIWMLAPLCAQEAPAWLAGIRAPALAFIADPQDLGPWWNTSEDPEVRRILALAQPSKASVAKAFEEGVPTAHIVRMPNVNHYVFLTNEADVLREMITFIAALK